MSYRYCYLRGGPGGPWKKKIDTQVPSQRTLVLNIVNSFKTDDWYASSFGNSMEVVLVPTFPVRASQLSGWSSFSEGFQWPLNRSQIEPSCEVWRLRTRKIKESIHIRKICGLDSQHGASSISKLLCNLIVIVAWLIDCLPVGFDWMVHFEFICW